MAGSLANQLPVLRGFRSDYLLQLPSWEGGAMNWVLTNGKWPEVMSSSSSLVHKTLPHVSFHVVFPSVAVLEPVLNLVEPQGDTNNPDWTFPNLLTFRVLSHQRCGGGHCGFGDSGKREGTVTDCNISFPTISSQDLGKRGQGVPPVLAQGHALHCPYT